MEILTGATVYTPLEVLRPGTVYIEGGRIAKVFLGVDKSGENLEGKIIGPGLVDLHIHGLKGHDVNTGTAEALLSLARELVRYGVTAFIPTAVTAPHEELLRISKAVAEAVELQRAGEKGARILGLELEGPYINPERRGAQNPEFIRPPNWKEFLEYWRASNGKIRTITVAPELPGALAFIEKVRSLGVVVSLGHTNATYEEAKAAILTGATRITHLFNAMPPIHHRCPGIVLASLESRMHLGIIADLVHISAPVLRFVWKVSGEGRIFLMSDAISAAGLEDGYYSLGGLKVQVRSGVARLTDGTLAGSTLTMDQAIRNLLAIDIPLMDSWIMGSYTPAQACREPSIGLLRPGMMADLVVLDAESLKVERVYVGGQRLL